MCSDMLSSLARWSWFRKVAALAAVGLLVLGGVYGVRRVARMQQADAELKLLAEQGMPTDSDSLNEFVALPPGEPDATGVWMAALGGMRSKIRSHPLGVRLMEEPDYLPPSPMDDWADLDAAAKYVFNPASSLARIDVALATPGQCVYVTDFRPEGFALGHLGDLRAMSRLLALRAFVHARHGDMKAAVGDLQGMVRASETLKGEPLLASQLVRVRLLAESIRAIDRLLPTIAGESDQLAELQSTLEQIDLREGLCLALIGSRANVVGAMGVSTNARLRGAWHGNDTLDVLESFAAVEKVLQQPWPEPLHLVKNYPQDIHFARAGSLSPWGQNDVAPSSIANMIASRVESIATVTARTRAAIAAIAAVRYHAQHGSWPESLDSLVPDYLAEVPTDPFTGKPLKMLVRADELRVYSVGKNLADDGGEEVIEANPDGALAPSGPDVVLRVKPE
jgi:hypothetical protein